MNDKPIIKAENDTRRNTAFIVILRALACLLIINSHCRDYYPIPFLAIGGGHGNAIFFILSGYCLANIKLNFGSWYKKRLNRILPITLVVLIIGAILDGVSSFTDISLWQIIMRFVNRYWFVSAIIIYYVAFYFLFKNKNKKLVLCALATYFIGYILLYCFWLDKTSFSVELEGFWPFKVYFYFGVFLCGGIIRLFAESGFFKDIKTIILFALLILSGFMWCGEYGFVMILQKGFNFQFFIHLGVMLFAVSLLLIFLKFSSKIKMSEGKFGKIINFLADSTLEIYLVQVTAMPHLPKMSFPLNWLIFVSISIFGGLILHYIANNIKFSQRG